jgi:hypothetical protein
MWGSALAIKWGAEKKAVTLNDGKGQGNNIAVFPTYVQGICAQLDLWRTSKNYRNKRFADAIAIWSGHNEVESYISFVTKRVPGLTRDTILDDDFWSGPMGILFLKAQAWHEAGKPYPAPDEDWIEARRRVFEGAAAPKPIVKSKIAQGGGVVVATEAADAGVQINDAIDKARQAKDVADGFGVTDVIVQLAHNPRFWVAVVIVLVVGAIIYWRWRDHGKGQ